MINDRHSSMIIQVCFPADKKENFAIVHNVANNKNCDSQVKSLLIL